MIRESFNERETLHAIYRMIQELRDLTSALAQQAAKARYQTERSPAGYMLRIDTHLGHTWVLNEECADSDIKPDWVRIQTRDDDVGDAPAPIRQIGGQP